MSRLSRLIRSTVNIVVLGDGMASKLKIVWVLWSYPVRRRWGFPDKEVVFKLKIDNRSCHITVNGSHDEFLILEEILGERVYDVSVQNPEIIFDMGGNIGLSAIFYALSYPSATVHTFEPSPTTYQRLVQNVVQCDNVVSHQLAVAKHEGLVTFYNYPQKSIASSLIMRGNDGVETTVAGSTLRGIMKLTNVDYIDILKFDIEGAEESLFQDIDLFDKVGYIIGEVHEDLMEISAETLFSFLRKRFELHIIPAGKEGRYIVRGHNKTVLQDL